MKRESRAFRQARRELARLLRAGRAAVPVRGSFFVRNEVVRRGALEAIDALGAKIAADETQRPT